MRLSGLLLLSGLLAANAFAQEAGRTPLLTLAAGSVVRLTGTESISAPFEYEVDLATKSPNLPLPQLLGQPLGVSPAAGWFVHGMIESVQQLEGSGENTIYRVRLVPSLSRLRLRSSSRVFHDMTTADIFKAIARNAGISNDEFEFRLTSALPKREQVVQYQEDDLTFARRILEDSGIHFHFEFTATGHKVVLSDVNTGFPLLTRLEFSTTATPSVSAFAQGQSLVPFDAPGSAAQVCEGTTTYVGLHAGFRVQLLDRTDRASAEYVLTSVEYRVGARGGYEASFQCIPSNIVFRPQAVTPHPQIAGIVQARVVGPAGTPQFVDRLGRVLVRYIFPSTAAVSPNDMNDSVYAPLAPPARAPPAIGAAVLISFERGDPDRPVVIADRRVAVRPQGALIANASERAISESSAATHLL